MPSELLYQQSEFAIALILLVVLAVTSELAYRVGRRQRRANSEPTRAEILGIHAGILGLLSLLLGFTFAMALSRFEFRKEMVVLEANAIGTAALRAQFLPAVNDSTTRALFRDYVAIRLESVLESEQQSAERQQLDERTAAIQQRLWIIARAAAEADPRSVPLALFVEAVNAMIDIKSRRDVAVANHVPEVVLVFLLAMSLLTIGAIGYGNGLAGARSPLPTLAYATIIVLVVVLILDLDRPQHGIARVSQASMQQVERVLSAWPR